MTYNYNSTDLVRPIELTAREEFLLKDSKTFCIYPWMHLHAYPTGEAYPCCHAEMKPGVVGNCRTNTLEEIWRGEPMQKLRSDMLSETPHAACTRCYEQEESGFFSGRKSANKHHGHHIKKLEENPFEMTYWDIRFSNLCNLSCRSCGHIFSSSWHQDQKKLLLQGYWDMVRGPDWPQKSPDSIEKFDQLAEFVKQELLVDFNGEFLRHLDEAKNLPVLNIAGRNEKDMWDQLLPHLDYVEQIYFAGGEPLMMEEHYRILDELERRGRFDVRLVYNTNFTNVKLKNRYVFDYWKKFEKVAVGASLDAMGARAEYIRHGTQWNRVVENRQRMLATCPDVDFYISPTLSIMNVLHLPDFHRDWVDRGLLKPQDLNVNILQGPAHYRIDIATTEYKQQIQNRYQDHLAWLEPLDPLNRATVGFRSALDFMMATDATHMLDKFWYATHQLDDIRRENVLDVLPELAALT